MHLPLIIFPIMRAPFNLRNVTNMSVKSMSDWTTDYLHFIVL
jgi:hypothetical protein